MQAKNEVGHSFDTRSHRAPPINEKPLGLPTSIGRSNCIILQQLPAKSHWPCPLTNKSQAEIENIGRSPIALLGSNCRKR